MARSVRNYKPVMPFAVPMILLVPVTTQIQGVVKKTFPSPSDVQTDYLFFGSFRTFGGTENIVDGTLTLINTATIDTWYRPDIQGDCHIYMCDTQETYEIISDPEDIQMRHQWLTFKVRKIGGKA